MEDITYVEEVDSIFVHDNVSQLGDVQPLSLIT